MMLIPPNEDIIKTLTKGEPFVFDGIVADTYRFKHIKTGYVVQITTEYIEDIGLTETRKLVRREFEKEITRRKIIGRVAESGLLR